MMNKGIVIGLLCLLSNFGTLTADVTVSRQVVLMGSQFGITVVAQDSTQAKCYIDTVISEISRIENIISEWRPQTQVSAVNRNAGISPVKVGADVLHLMKTALRFSHLTSGAFDVSIAAMDKIWKFDGSMDEMPSAEVIRKSVKNVGYQHIVVNEQDSTIYLKNKGMKIGFGSIGKAYAADKGRALLKQLGVKGGIVNASGDMATWGHPTHRSHWRVGITHPFRPEQSIRTLKLTEKAVVTSGNYEKYAEIDGTRYSHIIDPRTGYPATGLVSVTVVGASAEVANGISTSVMVLGEKKGRALLKHFPGYSVILVRNNGSIAKW